MYEVVFYTTERGESPIDAFLDDLNVKTRAKVDAHIELLEEHGPNLKRPYADTIRGKIRELRIPYSSNQYRILYFFFMRDQIVLTHALMKKTSELKEKDIALAEKRMQDWEQRKASGGKK